ncbi:MAG: ankyrin repeat domain-containing protein [Chamaesiphon sp. CSU_1_12]|nr:ankyrin repeat domain-containing protein [Chamaesiphon sp. CSU_1_12]
MDTAIMSVDPQTQRLFDAIAAANYSQVKRAIEAGVAVNRPNALGQTPLAMACQLNNLEIVDLLVAAGGRMQADAPFAQHSAGKEALDEREIPVKPADLPIPSTQLSPLERLRQYQQTSAVPMPPAQSREVAYDNLIELIHQPTNNRATAIDESLQIPLPNASIEPPVQASAVENAAPTAAVQPSAAPQSAATGSPNHMETQWEEFTADAENTYTFDLDAVFAERDRESASSGLAARYKDGTTERGGNSDLHVRRPSRVWKQVKPMLSISALTSSG